MSLENISCI